MARRHESLVTLSRDHYDGLLLAHQIKTDDRVMMAGWPAQPQERATFVAQFYQDHLLRHFKEEEEALFPLIVRHVPSGRGQVENLLSEHRKIEEFVREFQSQSLSNLPQRLNEFSDLLEGHIRKEERELFPLFEREAPAEALEEARRLLTRE